MVEEDRDERSRQIGRTAVADDKGRTDTFSGAAVSADGAWVTLSFAGGEPVSIPRAQLQDAALALMALVQPEPIISSQPASVTAFNISWWQMRPTEAGGATITFDVGPAQISFALEPSTLRDLATGAATMVGSSGA